jgi:heme/copper-type cytochrome/quinol oxidase subunit 4
MPVDPLSLTLAVVAFATALKDIIETAEVIRDSFSKVCSFVDVFVRVSYYLQLNRPRRTIEMRNDLQKRCLRRYAE